MKYEDLQNVKENLLSLLDLLDNIEYFIFKYTLYLNNREKDEIIVKFKDKDQPEIYEFETYFNSELSNFIREFEYKILDAAEERAEKYLYDYIRRHYPGAVIENIENVLRSNYRKIKIKIKYNSKLIELSIKYYRSSKDIDEEGNLVIIDNITISFTDHIVNIYEYL